MSEFKGTKGPWECVDMDDDSISEISATMVVCGDVVLAVVGPTADSSLPEDEHNAKLIAVAPDLLEALQKLVMELEITLRVGYERIIDLGGSCDEPQAMIDGYSEITMAKEAIAKALGETK